MDSDQKKQNKAIFLDRDGVINYERGDYTWKIDDFIINDGINESLSLLQKHGYLLIIISNQGGISKNIYSKSDVKILHKHLKNELLKREIQLTDIFYCPHHTRIENCICRKPDSLLFEKALAKYNINPTNSYMFGDKQSDIDSAKKLGIKGFLLKANESIFSYCQQIISLY